MLAKILLILLALGNAAFSMDQEESDETDDIELGVQKNNPPFDAELANFGKGLTVGEAFDALLSLSTRNTRPNICGERPSVIFMSAGLASFFSGIAGTVFAGLGCPPPGKLTDGLCITGLTLVGAAVASITIPTIIYLLSLDKSGDEKFNQNLRTRLTNEFRKGRDRAELLTREDIEYLGFLPTMQLAQGGMGKFSPRQILWLAELDRTQFAPHTGRVGNLLVIKLQKLLSLESAELINTLNESETHKLFQDDAELFASLCRCLKKDGKIDEDLQEELDEIKTIIERQKTEESEDSRNGEMPNDLELVSASGKQFSVNRECLGKVSTKFADMFADKDLEISKALKVEENWADDELSMLAEFAQRQQIAITEENVLMALKIGHGFVISALIDQCDSFLLHERISPELLGKWLTGYCNYEDKMLEVGSAATMWHFCDQFKLKQNKRKLIEQLVKQIQNLTRTGTFNNSLDSGCSDLALLRDHDLQDFLYFYGARYFRGQLKITQFLAWAWDHMKHISLFKEEIIEFCKAPANETTIAAAWVNMPADLLQEIGK